MARQRVESVVIVGSGNVAEAFARALRRAGITVVQVFARNPVRGRKVARAAGAQWSCRPEELAAADLYIIAVSDNALAGVASSLPFAAQAIVAHTAGCGTLDSLPAAWPRAVIYPFQTFTAGRRISLRRVPLFVEASDGPTLAAVLHFAGRLSGRVAEADSALRAQIHLCGVLACNFTNHLYALAAGRLTRAGLDFGVLAPIISETAAKAVASGDPRLVQTGPAVRGDSSTVARHLAMLDDEPVVKEIYKEISNDIWRTSKRD